MLRNAILAAAVLIAGGAVWILTRDAPARDPAAIRAAAKDSEKSRAAQRKADEDSELRAQLAKRPVGEGPSRPAEPPPSEADDPGRPQSQQEVVDNFEAYMGELADLEMQGARLSDDQKKEVYVQARTQLAALTEQFDARDPNQAAYLEGARATLMAQLERLKTDPSSATHMPAPGQGGRVP